MSYLGLRTRDMDASDRCIVKISHRSKRRNYPSSPHTRRWIPKDPMKSSWMKNLHEFPHDKLWITFHGLLEFTSNPTLKSRPYAKSDKLCQWYNLWMRIKGLHNYTTMALGSCVKWPLSHYETPSLNSICGYRLIISCSSITQCPGRTGI